MIDNSQSMIRTRLWSPVIAFLSLAIHAVALLAWQQQVPVIRRSVSAPPMQVHVHLRMEPVPPASPKVVKQHTTRTLRSEPVVQEAVSAPPTPGSVPASRAAPPAPTAEEWQLASTYTLKNSKRYRYNWGQQVLSMMGTVVEGPQQGYVRFRIEIAPDGKVTRVDTLWSTSEVAEKLARKSIAALPPLPPTPTGRPLVFEQTIAYVPYDSGWPPIYKYDCLPDPPAFRNPFAWDGKSPQVMQRAPPAAEMAPNDADCAKSAQQDSVDAEAADIKRQLDYWGALPLNGVQ